MSALTDRELLEKAAKAAGYKVAWEGGGVTGWMAGATWWNPLTDDGDAFRLAVKLRLAPSVCTDYTVMLWDDLREDHGADPYAATRRAIVRAAAAQEQAS